MRKLFFLVFILLFGTQVFCQSDFRSGYIIKNSNDTIYGLIDYRGNAVNTKSCSFKKSEDADRQRFSPQDLIGYRFTNSKYYVSRVVQLAKSKEEIFLEYLINGIVDIYFYRDENGGHFLVDQGDGNLYELKNEEKMVHINNVDYIIESKEYVGLLKSIFGESMDIVKQVDQVSLNHKSLIKIAHKYHNEVCPNEQCVIYEGVVVKPISKFGLLVGMNAYTVKDQSGYPDFPVELYYFQNSDFNIAFFPSIGFFYKRNMPKVNEKIYFQYEFTYNRVKLNSYTTFNDYDFNLTYLNDVRFTRNSINNAGSFRYEFPRGKFRPSFHLGAFINYFFKTKYQRDLEVLYVTGNTYYTDRFNERPFSTFDFGVSIGMGLNFPVGGKDVFIDLKYQRGWGVLLPILYTHHFSVDLGYPLGK